MSFKNETRETVLFHLKKLLVLCEGEEWESVTRAIEIIDEDVYIDEEGDN